jgi:hypothetical protein
VGEDLERGRAVEFDFDGREKARVVRGELVARVEFVEGAARDGVGGVGEPWG